MKRSILPLLCCPVCKGDLTLTVTAGDDKEIREGKLHCPICRVNYPIEDGIPDLLPRQPPE
ncbi:MAG: Trm112 family protein [Methanomicrobiales archaeon]|nr:Trm112 family protein [Methanomicrobiales archaeon]NYT21659.1 Trm112 family protein [Methanomicrobiales archaeon]